jgi:hypothetical protein
MDKKENRGHEFDQSTSYVCMEISQQNPFVWLICTNKNNFKNRNWVRGGMYTQKGNILSQTSAFETE